MFKASRHCGSPSVLHGEAHRQYFGLAPVRHDVQDRHGPHVVHIARDVGVEDDWNWGGLPCL